MIIYLPRLNLLERTKQSLYLIISLFILITVTSVNAAETNSNSHTKVVSSLLTDIKTAERQLNTKQVALAKQQKTLSNKIFKQQQALSALRKQASLNRRLADEDTLSLDKLQTRLNEWQQQQQYQLNLLNRFVRQYGDKSSTQQKTSNKQNELLQQVVTLIEQQSTHLYPSFQSQSVVLENGELTPAHTLQVGPVAWFTVDNTNTMGLLDLESDSNVAKVALIQSDSNEHSLSTALKTLNNNSQPQKIIADLTFDPSLNHMVASQSQEENAFEHLQKGGLWAIPIIAFACFALIIALLKSIQLIRLAKIDVYSQIHLVSLYSQNKLSQFKGMQRNLFQLSIDNKKGDLRDDQLFNQLSRDKHTLDNWVGAIAVTAAVAPLLGLLGTVSGMIETFKMMTLFGSGDPEVVSGGIAQALITTELGLVVAIPALILNALLSRKVKSYYSQLEAFSIQLSQVESNTDTNVHPINCHKLNNKVEEDHV
ncbi:MotA/TolQ/ExbB proton channel family protein [Pseudocolwellia sp. HL-MZ7]|uniref:MotA/TolQ/ExbB proton channel family protein n=1 Tax=Pseudocolwellia sp. HL-MZ7 TaxID=3400627 RepID=UPI003CE994D1